ncbi:MAG: hypothetical protein Q8L48_25335 [Archangium sp.]|nr:hypothetical protein [Archangium sp.]
MALREWSPKSYFRNLTPPTLAVLRTWAKAELKPIGSGKPWEQTYRAWKALPETARMKLETALLPVNDLCVPDARPRLEELAATVWATSAMVEQCRSWSSQDLATRLFVAAPAAFANLHQSYVVDSMEHLKEYAGRYAATPCANARSKAALKDALMAHLRETAFGPRCHIEDFANAEKFALFVFHEDEVVASDRFTHDDEIEPAWERDVVRLAAVFHFESNVLMVKAARKEEREKLRDLFAQFIVGDAGYFQDAKLTPRFSFDPLRDREFGFPVLPGSRVVGACVQKVVVRPQVPDVKRLVVEFRQAVAVPEVHEALQAHGVDADRDTIEGVHLRFNFEGSGRSRSRTVSLFNPNSSNLRDTPRDRVIRRHLKVWGFDANNRRVSLASSPLEATAH